MTREQFIHDLTNGSAHMGVQLHERAKESLFLYFSELMKWNLKINLVSRNEPDWLRVHFLDSLAPLGLGLIGGQERMIDLGAGAGFPGVPLKIACTGTSLAMAEASSRKCAWLRHLVRHLELEGTEVLEGRFQDLVGKPGRRGSFNLAVSRAAARPEKVVQQAASFLAEGARLLVFTTKELVVNGTGKIYPYQVPGSHLSSVIWEVMY